MIARPWRPGVVYRSGTDPSGGTHDSFCSAVAHLEGNVAVLDAVLEIKSPCNPSEATRQVCELLRSYRLTQTTGDHFGAGWVTSEFSKNGCRYVHSKENRSEVYLSVLPLLNSQRVRLLDNRRLATQFCNLERRTSTMGRDIIDHGVGGMDALCNAASLVLNAAVKPGVVTSGTSIIICGGRPRNIPAVRNFDGTSRVFERMLRTAGRHDHPKGRGRKLMNGVVQATTILNDLEARRDGARVKAEAIADGRRFCRLRRLDRGCGRK